MTLHTHLKMEGAWHVHAPGTRWRRPAHEARVVLATAGGRRWVRPRRGRAAPHGPRGAARSGTSAPTCSGPTGTRRRPFVGWPRIPAAPSARPCSTNATSQASARSSGPRPCSCPASRPSSPCQRCRTSAKVVKLARRLLVANRERPQITTTGVDPAWEAALGLRPGRTTVSSLRDQDQDDHAGPRALRPGDVLVPVLPARALRRDLTRARGRRPRALRVISGQLLDDLDLHRSLVLATRSLPLVDDLQLQLPDLLGLGQLEDDLAVLDGALERLAALDRQLDLDR